VTPPPPARPARGLADALLSTYQRKLRRPEPAGPGGCPFEPTCSHFARQAVDRYGLVGLLLVVDRLFVREHFFAGARYESTCVAGHWRWHDPLP
jgi:putative component of membrane protein insertase Oxa1/YidC/SpoIIIJ protein YidD